MPGVVSRRQGGRTPGPARSEGGGSVAPAPAGDPARAEGQCGGWAIRDRLWPRQGPWVGAKAPNPCAGGFRCADRLARAHCRRRRPLRSVLLRTHPAPSGWRRPAARGGRDRPPGAHRPTASPPSPRGHRGRGRGRGHRPSGRCRSVNSPSREPFPGARVRQAFPQRDHRPRCAPLPAGATSLAQPQSRHVRHSRARPRNRALRRCRARRLSRGIVAGANLSSRIASVRPGLMPVAGERDMPEGHDGRTIGAGAGSHPGAFPGPPGLSRWVAGSPSCPSPP